MNKEEQAAYYEALKRIAACRCVGERGTALDLHDLDLTTLPPEIGQLSALTWLDLSRNHLTTLPPEIGQLSGLTQFFLHRNQLTTLPPEIGQLKALTVLNLSFNQITILPPEIGQLSGLSKLDLSNNQLTTLPPEIGQLSALTRLSLSQNQLTTLPPEIGQLSVVGTLDLDNNQLMALPPQIVQLSAMTELRLSNNQLRALPPEFGHLSALTALYLHENPGLVLTAEVLGPTWEDIANKNAKPALPQTILKTYFALRRGMQPLHEVKLILIGRGEAGKTSVVRALMGQPFREEKETPGIAIGTWPLDCNGTPIKVHVWDFAGQEITHEAHRFFLTERCIYLVVTEGRFCGQDEDADHWLAHVEQYGTHQEPGKPPQTSPALVVGNKADLCAVPLEKRRLQREHPCVRKFLETDCKTGRGIAELKKKICEIIESKEMDSVRQPFPTEWQRMKERMEDWKKLNRHSFTYDEFAEECGKEMVAQGDELALTHVLNQLGIALYYGHNPKLRDTRVLDPQWLVNGMYALIRGVEKHGDKSRPGELREDEVEQRLEQGLELMKGSLALADYPPDARKFLLELMVDRELCFVARETADGMPVYLLPGLLPKDEPEHINLESYLAFGPDCVRLRFGYRLLPDGLVPRFIVRTHSLSREQPRWRRGVILQWQGAETGANPVMAALLADMKQKRVEVAVKGGTAQSRQELAGMVRTHLKNIHAELPQALAPVEELELSPAGEQWHGVDTLEKAAQQGKRVQVLVGQTFEELPPEEELQQVEPPTAWQANAQEMALRVFISYSHDDHQHLYSLTTPYLAVLENEKLIHQWTDGEIRTGENWDERIREEIRSTDIVVLLLSENFFASHYIQGVEVKLARKRHEAGEAEIFPVLLSGESWKQHEWLKKLQIAPKRKSDQELVPLMDFKPRQAAGWEAVQAQLRKVIETLRESRKHWTQKRPKRGS